MPVRLVISICHRLLLVSCNDRRGVDYATTLTQALLQVLASYTISSVFFQFPRLNSHSHALNSHSHPMADLTPIPMGILWDPCEWDPMQSSPFSCTPLFSTCGTRPAGGPQGGSKLNKNTGHINVVGTGF